MTEHPGFLADIIANPDDDTPRLIYADWLDENGQEERAKFIRESVVSGLCFYPESLPARLFGVSNLWVSAWQGRRGFVESVTMSADQWMKHCGSIIGKVPVIEVKLTGFLFQHWHTKKPNALSDRVEWQDRGPVYGPGPKLWIEWNESLEQLAASLHGDNVVIPIRDLPAETKQILYTRQPVATCKQSVLLEALLRHRWPSVRKWEFTPSSASGSRW